MSDLYNRLHDSGRDIDLMHPDALRSELRRLRATRDAELAALVRKAAEHVPYVKSVHYAQPRIACICNKFVEDDVNPLGPQWRKHINDALLTPPMESALAEHNSGIRAECNGEWLNMIVRLFGPIPCGGTSLEIAERHLAEHDAKVRAEVATGLPAWQAWLDAPMACGHAQRYRTGIAGQTDEQWERSECAECVICERETAETALAEAQKVMPCGHPWACRVGAGPSIAEPAYCTVCKQLRELRDAAVPAAKELDRLKVGYAYGLQGSIQPPDIKVFTRFWKAIASATALLEGK